MASLHLVIRFSYHLIRKYRFFLIMTIATVAPMENTSVIDLQRRRFTLAALALPGAWPHTVAAQPAPETLRIVVGYPPGGSVDIVARKLAERLAPQRVRHAIVENKPGAAGRLAVDELRRAPADGSAVLLTPASVVTLYPHVYRQLSYDPFADLAPVAPVCASGFALAVGPRVPESVASIEAFARWCRANPAAAQCGNAGAGSMPHLLALLLGRELGIELAHVPYRAGGAAMQAVAAGELAAALATESSARTLQQAGKLRVLATSWAERSPFLPAVPTFREQGLAALTQREWFGVLAPARTPTATAEALAEALRSLAQDADVRQTWDRAALLPEVGTPAQLAASMRQEHAFWGGLVKATGFAPEA